MITLEGKIVHIVQDKGYGFIQSDTYDTNIFFHAKFVTGTPFIDLKVGDIVDFEPIQMTDRGMMTPRLHKKVKK